MYPFELNTTEKLVKVASLQTNIEVITDQADKDKVCSEMCRYMNEEGLKVINQTNPDLCSDPCLKYLSLEPTHERE